MFVCSVLLLAVVAVAHANVYYGFEREFSNNPIRIPADVAIDDTTVPINPRWQTIVLVHGHQEDLNSEFNHIVKNEILKNREANVIVVDWSTYSKLSYSNAVGSVPNVGKQLGEFLVRLERQARIAFANLHLVGFNLGAHAVGYAGREVFKLTQIQVARITGLDPSRSQWGSGTPRLSSADAVYVEVIHTDGEGLSSNGLGTPTGDVDFFVNGGSNQPGCLSHACSHRRAYELFAGTFMRPERMYGNLCASSLQVSLNRCTSVTLHVGDDTLNKQQVNGIYRVNTGRNYPY